MSQTRARLIRRFADKNYRHDSTESFFDTLVAAQIRALRERNKWSQKRLGDETGTTQSGISAFESSDYSRWSVNTLRKFARAFDVALVVRFASFGEALEEIEEFGGPSVFVHTFDNDPAFKSPEAPEPPEYAFNIGEPKLLTLPGFLGLVNTVAGASVGP